MKNLICRGCGLDSGHPLSSNCGANKDRGYHPIFSNMGACHYFCEYCTRKLADLAGHIHSIVKDEYVAWVGLHVLGQELGTIPKKDKG